MPEYEKNHYLPVFYLKGWCDPTGKVIRYHRPRHKVVASPVHPTGTGYERRLYWIEGAPEHLQHRIESQFMKEVDDRAARAARTLLTSKQTNLPIEIRRDFARFVMSLHVRTPLGLDKVRGMFSEAFTTQIKPSADGYAKERREADASTVLEWIRQKQPHLEGNAAKLLLPDLIDNQQIGNDFMNMRWVTLNIATVTRRTLLLGDNPLIRNRGLADPRCIWALPLSPTMLFLAAHNDEVLKPFLSGTFDKVVSETNSATVQCASASVFGNSTNQLRFVENRLRRRAKYTCSSAS